LATSYTDFLKNERLNRTLQGSNFSYADYLNTPRLVADATGTPVWRLGGPEIPYTKKPNVRLYTWKRVGDDVNDFYAIKLLKFSVYH
jgi:hypothetical protein